MRPYISKQVRVETRLGYNRTSAVHHFIDFERPRNEIVRALMRDEDNVKASVLANKFKATHEHEQDCAVYLFQAGDLPVLKVGVSANPRVRHSEIQTHLWSELSLVSLLWTNAVEARSIELSFLRYAKKFDIHLRGEWVQAEPEDGVEMIVKIAASRECRFRDSRCYLDNLNASVKAMGISKGLIAA